MCRVTRLNDHGRLQATWCLSAESRSAARRPSAPSAPLRAYEDRLGRFVATRKSVGKRSRHRNAASGYVRQQTSPINVALAKTLISAILQSCNTILVLMRFFFSGLCFFYLFIYFTSVCVFIRNFGGASSMNNSVPCHKCAVLSTFAPVRGFKCSGEEWGTITGAGEAVAGLLIPPSGCIDGVKGSGRGGCCRA